MSWTNKNEFGANKRRKLGQNKREEEGKEEKGGEENDKAPVNNPLPLGWTRVKPYNPSSSTTTAATTTTDAPQPQDPPSPLPTSTSLPPRPPSPPQNGIPSICYYPSPQHPWFSSRCLNSSSTSRSFLFTESTLDPCVDCGDGSYKEYEYVMYTKGIGGVGRREVGGKVKRTGGTEGSILWDGDGLCINFVPSGVNGLRDEAVKVVGGLEGMKRWDDVGRKYFSRIWDKGVGDEGYFTYGWWVISEE